VFKEYCGKISVEKYSSKGTRVHIVKRRNTIECHGNMRSIEKTEKKGMRVYRILRKISVKKT
jgi:hypothetical protein